MTTMTAIHAKTPGADLEVVEVAVPRPGRGHVLVKVEACGICHSDASLVGDHLPGISFPCQPGHEIAGVVVELGEEVTSWALGDRVAVGWGGGYCGECEACRAGDMVNCPTLMTPGRRMPGGYAEFVCIPTTGLARIPDGMSFVQAAGMGCAGVTVYNGLRHTRAMPGDIVAVLGVGGLGHLAVQFARAMGFRVVAIARGEGKRALAMQLGAHAYVDSTTEDVAATLQAMGGAKVVLATVTASAAMTEAFNGLGRRGEFVVLGASVEPLQISPVQLITNSRSVVGHASGTASDVEDTMRFADLAGVEVWVEEAPLSDAPAAYAEMMAGTPRFRKVLVPAVSGAV